MVAGLLLCFVTGSAQAAERWGVVELSFEAEAAERSWVDVELAATFELGGKQRVRVPGFWDGGTTFRVRFSPPEAGTWTYKTVSNNATLDGKIGTVEVEPASGANHGPVEVFDTFYLRYEDGTPYHQFGTTCYAWVHQPEALQEQTLATLAKAPFNKIRFCVFPKSYVYNQNEPERFAFVKRADGSFDFDRPDPEFWRHFEKRILDLQALGIEADLILWHPYDRWGFADMTDQQDDRYLRYAIARLGAFRNVWWSLANEFDFMTDRPKGHRGNKQMEDWDRFFAILQKEDVHHRLRGIHNGAKWYDHTKEWVTHASLQTSDMKAGVDYRQRFQKPVIYDECKYEGDVPQGWGNLSGQEMAQRFWLGTLSGCYVGHGETYLDAKDVLWWSKGGVLKGESPKRILWLKDFLREAPAFHELEPLGDDQGRFVLGKPGAYYLVYRFAGEDEAIVAPDDREWKVDAVDPWGMEVWASGSTEGGKFTPTPYRSDLVYRLTPYAEGETRRPLARPTADAAGGQAPLDIQFQSNTKGAVTWDFGDGDGSEEANPSHRFDGPGVYVVTLSVSDGRGGKVRGHVVVRVDRDVSQPIARAGFAEGEMPALGLHGTAKRGSGGSLVFPAGEPWGRAEVEGEELETLAGLQSFTVMGWLKPSSLETGSGGNRILYCLKESRAGIDLVHLADGRLRLSVNEWPDRVSNDSAAGKLVPGKWTFFAVTYDGTAEGDNTRWYFSEPLEMRTSQAPIVLDRQNSYRAGGVADQTGPLAVGNFNRSMQGYGWDRQFRGEISGLLVFGSRVSGAGALSAQEIRRASRP